mmetsp:Transcript_36180/g.90298  ORF Transcript_36180/g.90298 Transcript_36180/m.90298 type:complete len:247 (-) Transcript_36180:193-933(-)
MRSGLRALAHEVVKAAAVDTGSILGVCLLQLAHFGVVHHGAPLVDRLDKGRWPLAQQLAVRLWPCKRARRRTVRSAVGCRRPHPLQTCPLLPPKPVGGLPGNGRVHNVADHRLELGHRLRSDALGRHAHGLRVEIQPPGSRRQALEEAEVRKRGEEVLELQHVRLEALDERRLGHEELLDINGPSRGFTESEHRLSKSGPKGGCLFQVFHRHHYVGHAALETGVLPQARLPPPLEPCPSVEGEEAQ